MIMIRYYEKEDIKQIAKIIDEDWKIAYKGIVDENYLKNLNYKDREKRIREKYKKEKSIVFVEDNIVKGYCRFGKNREGEKIGEIIALYIKNEFRRCGIGEELVKKAKEILKERGYKEMIIWCLKENSAGRNFYEKQKCVLDKERKFKIGDKYHDEVSYKYIL